MRERIKGYGLVLWRTYNRWQEDDGPLMSAAVAYYLGLSLFPMLLLVIAGLGAFFRQTDLGQDAERQVLRVVAEQVSPAVERHIRGMLAQVQDRSAIGGKLGVVGVLIAAIAGFTQFERAFDHIWDVPASDKKGVLAGLWHTLIERGVAFLMLLCVGALVVSVFIAGVVIAALDHYFTEQFGVSQVPGPLLRVLVSMLLNSALFTLIYRFLPPARVLWSEALRAGMFAGAGWELGRLVLATWVISARYASAYGVVGSFLAVLLWCYYAVAVIFLGAEYLKETCSLCEQHGAEAPSHGEPEPASDVHRAERHRDILHSAEHDEHSQPARH